MAWVIAKVDVIFLPQSAPSRSKRALRALQLWLALSWAFVVILCDESAAKRYADFKDLQEIML
jgi:hypothetical protein